MSNQSPEEIHYIVTYKEGFGYRLRAVPGNPNLPDSNQWEEMSSNHHTARLLISSLNNTYEPQICLYLGHISSDDTYKIGVTKGTWARSLRVGMVIQHEIYDDKSKIFEIEKVIHKSLKQYNVKGHQLGTEIFRLPPQIINSIKTCKTVDDLWSFAFSLI